MGGKTNVKTWQVILLFLLVVAVCTSSVFATGTYNGGDGSEGNPFQINTPAQMDEIGQHSEDWDKHFILTADIDLSGFTGTEFNIIGIYWSKAFIGVFDGNGHTISNFTYTSTGVSYVGLFSFVGTGGEIKDLGMVNVDVDAGSDAGSGGYRVGSLVGVNDGTVSNCYSTGSVSGTGSYIGGLVGWNGEGGVISTSYSTGSVTGNNWYVGGLVGDNIGTIRNCYARGQVNGYAGVGGLAGGGIPITNCYSTGLVTGTGLSVGGLVGAPAPDGGPSVSFWDTQTSGQSTSNGGRGLTTTQMQDPNTYIGWGCEGVWTIDAGVDYPRLIWENAPGDLIDAQLSDFVTGAGTEAEPYLIYTAEQLNLIGLFVCDWDKDFKLMANINLGGYTGTSFNTIGTRSDAFTGVFDGNGHTISDFAYSATGDFDCDIGLFGYIDGANAEVKSLGLTSPNIEGGKYVGGLVGRLQDGRVSGCFVNGGSISGNEWVGGLVSFNGGIISNCYSTASVSGNRSVGGLVAGNNRDAVITNCYATGSVSASVGGRRVGGLVGLNGYGAISNCYATGAVTGDYDVGGLVGWNWGTVSNCYSTGDVVGETEVGGLVGWNEQSIISIISNCYATGAVTGTTNVGGLVGWNTYDISESFWDTQTSGQTNMCGGGSGSGCDNSYGKTTAEMQDIDTFLAAGWDFVGEFENGPSDEWAQPSGGEYMILWWQLSPLPPLPSFSGGTGEANDPYLISTAVELNQIEHNSRLMNKHFELIDDIGLAGVDFFLIGSLGCPYTGVFDGNGHTISNFAYDCNEVPYIGLFRVVSGPSANIKNLGLVDPNVDAGTGRFVGALVGSIRNAAITGCYVEGGTVSGDICVGGLVGRSPWAEVTNCYSMCSVSGVKYVGGVVGSNLSDPFGSPPGGGGTITNCHSTASVTGDEAVGGLVGWNVEGGTVTDCSASATVSGNYDVGGLVGCNRGGYTEEAIAIITNCKSSGSVTGQEEVGGLVGLNRSECRISNCYSTASVTGDSRVGGLAGVNFRGEITDCYSSGDVNGTDDVGGLVGWNDKTITNCHSTSTVTGTGNYVGGLVGHYANDWGPISNCYARGSVSGVQYVGGLAGRSLGPISDCYATGDVTGVLDVGGLVGENEYYSSMGYVYMGTIANCYSTGNVMATLFFGGLTGTNDGEISTSLWDTQTSGLTNMCGRQGGSGTGCDDGNGKTTVEMQMASTFISAGWDFVLVWDICEGTSYPRLVWQIPVGDMVCPYGVEMRDFSVLGLAWLSSSGQPNWNPVCDISDPNDNFIDELDLGVFCDNWLAGVE